MGGRVYEEKKKNWGIRQREWEREITAREWQKEAGRGEGCQLMYLKAQTQVVGERWRRK